MNGEFCPTVYILASRRNGTLYIGVTSNLIPRLHQHRNAELEGFTKRYGIHQLAWFEQHSTMESAIVREKQLKKWNRAWKLRMIEKQNPDWQDLALDFGFAPMAQAGFPPSRE